MNTGTWECRKDSRVRDLRTESISSTVVERFFGQWLDNGAFVFRSSHVVVGVSDGLDDYSTHYRPDLYSPNILSKFCAHVCNTERAHLPLRFLRQRLNERDR